MTDAALHKVHRDHLRRDAYLYVRQSTLRQVLENTESTQRQYALRERAVALGWPRERIEVIDSDLGRSGAASADREGFNRLITQVSLGSVGIVLGLEVSRLARNSADWHGLVELCSLTDTLILDEDGVYSPSDFNDRLLLGIKGTMSEAELHLIRARLIGGILAAARRGELRMALPTGLSYGPDSQVQLDPDSQVQASLTHFFATFERLGSASATVRHFSQQGLLFPRRVRTGPRRGETVWGPLGHHRALAILHNPRYAGAFVFGRRRRRRRPDGSMRSETVPQSEWAVLLPDAHPGYIGWDRFEANDKLLRANRTARDPDRSRTPPREGPALLQGLVTCGVCGRGMTVRYRSAKGGLQPSYVCQQQGVETGSSPCQSIPGGHWTEPSGSSWSRPSRLRPWRRPWKCKPSWRHARPRPTPCAASASNGRSRRPNGRTGCSRMLRARTLWPARNWKHAGTASSANCARPRENSSAAGRPGLSNWPSSSGSKSGSWLPTSRACGAPPRHRNANASG